MTTINRDHQFTSEHLGEVVNGWPLRNFPRSAHGPDHWLRVYQNARHLLEEEGLDSNVDIDSMYWAALYHDSKRVDEMTDPGHGGRGAVHLLTERTEAEHPDDIKAIRIAAHCCALHTELQAPSSPLYDDGDYQRLTGDLPTQTRRLVEIFCDSDRLDIGRVGYRPDHRFMFTDAAKEATQC